MELMKLAYTGRKPFNDKRHGSFHEWQPGEEKLVSHMAAKKLLKYAEFSIAPQKPAKPTKADKASAEPTAEQQEQDKDKQAQEDAERTAALANIEQQEQAIKQEYQAKEDMLLAISTWDKDQLKDYAVKYDVTVNKTRALQAIREEVSGLVDQFGVR